MLPTLLPRYRQRDTHISNSQEHQCRNIHQHPWYRGRLRTVRLFLPKLLLHSSLPMEASTHLNLLNLMRHIGTRLWATLLALNILPRPLPSRSKLSSPRTTKSPQDKGNRHL